MQGPNAGWVTGVMCILVLTGSSVVALGQATTKPAQTRGFAVVELFTSEGCSSCPPADEVADRLARKAALRETPVHVLAFHVDYWDRLGWPDRFAQAAFTTRQRQYAAQLSGGRLYTPQMVVNGHAEFVGSRGDEADRLIKGAVGRAAELRIDLAPVKRPGEGNRFQVSGQVHGDTLRGRVLQVALVESELASKITRGENAGRTLRHARVVRTMVTIDAAPSFEVALPFPEDLKHEHAAVVVFAQAKSSLEVVGAVERSVAP